VRRDAGRYYLHQVDRDYALSRIPAGEPADRAADPAPFTQQALRHRGADYFAQTRTPRADWKTLDDLAPQLNEYELRCQGGDYYTAAQVLLGISFDYLIRWGHYRLTVQMHERLQGHLDDPWINAVSEAVLGMCYLHLGQIPQAIDLYQQALAIFRETGNRASEGAVLGNLGACYYELGQLPQAIDLYEQALTVSRETGSRANEGSILSGLGICCRQLGQLPRAIDLCEQALAIARQTGKRESEATDLGNLGICYRDLGQLTRAIDLYEQALTVSRETGSRRTQSNNLDNLADAFGNLGAWSQAAEYSRQAIEMADAISIAQAQNEARLTLARIQLLAGDPQAAQQTALAARDHPYPLFRAQVSLLLGITQLRQDRPAAAAQEFRDAAAQASALLQQASGAYEAQDTRALALCGLALTAHSEKAEAIAAFRAARAITSADGIVKQVLALFDALATAGHGDILAGIRPAAEGKGDS
jgi:tetratricopeptide (TPR) repeat protein